MKTPSSSESTPSAMPRRDFLKLSTVSAGALSTVGISAALEQPQDSARPAKPGGAAWGEDSRYNGLYTGERLSRVAFPMGGIGAGMICLEGTGALSHVSLRHQPEVFNEPCMFAAISLRGKPGCARVLEGPVPGWKLFGSPEATTSYRKVGPSYGLPRFRNVSFKARFPFGTVELNDPDMPVTAELTGWSPFEPGDADNASLPVAALEYRITNSSGSSVSAVFSFNARNFMAVGRNTSAVKRADGGFVLMGMAPKDRGWEEGAFSATVSESKARVNCAWFRGGWFDALTMAWKDIVTGECPERLPITEGDPSPGASLFVPFELKSGESRTIVLRLAWHVRETNLREPEEAKRPVWSPASGNYYAPWYPARFSNIENITSYWRDNYEDLRRRSQRFSDCFYDTTLPPEVIDAVAANLAILKSPTVLRQADGRLWAWEGCNDNSGSCHGSCTHVWNYAQALPHLFPSLERTLRETEFKVSQNEQGHQAFRTSLPIRPTSHEAHTAADGQLGGIMKVCREWRISGDAAWLRDLWPKVKASLDYCIATWDPKRKGWLEEPHHNTYDIEFWGPNGMCTSFYLGALRAAVLMGQALDEPVGGYDELFQRGVQRTEKELFDGEYFIQKIQWEGLQAKDPLTAPTKYFGGYSPEARELLKREGPRYQYGSGCLSDGVLGSWMALVCGVGQVLDPAKVASHLQAVHRHNLKRDLSSHANPQRPTYACGAEGGLLLCSWPKGGELSLPFVYSNEVWTGIEYQVASHLMFMGMVAEGLEIVRTCRDRYDGRIRNPFNEYECGHWYARAMASYALLEGLTGARYDAIEKVLYLKPRVTGDFRSFLSTATGYGTVGIKNGKPFLDVVSGTIEVREIRMG